MGMPFGVKNGPPTYQSVMNKMLIPRQIPENIPRWLYN